MGVTRSCFRGVLRMRFFVAEITRAFVLGRQTRGFPV